jgi:drug/metabolite transporter (DMT)-like permease
VTGHTNKTILFAAFFAIYFIWGTTYLAIRYAIESIPPFMMMGIRSVFAGLVLYIWGLSRGDTNATRKELPSLVIIGFLFFLVGHGILAWAEKTVPSGVAALLIAVEPIILTLFEPLFTREGRVTGRVLLGMLFGFSGIAVLVVPQGLDLKNANLLGSLGILLCTCSWAGGAIYSRVTQLPKSPFIRGGLQLLSGGIMLIVASYLLGEWHSFAFSGVTLRSWMGVSYLIVFGSIIAFSAYTWLLTVTSATRISTHTFINPVIALLVGWAIGGETLTYGMLVATLLIIVAIYLVLIRKKDGLKVAEGETT